MQELARDQDELRKELTRHHETGAGRFDSVMETLKKLKLQLDSTGHAGEGGAEAVVDAGTERQHLGVGSGHVEPLGVLNQCRVAVARSEQCHRRRAGGDGDTADLDVFEHVTPVDLDGRVEAQHLFDRLRNQ